MTTTVTKESLAVRIAELESGARSLKEDYTLAAYKMLLATMEAEPVVQKEPVSFDEWSRKCALQVTLCYPDFREKAQYIWDSARETQQPTPVVFDAIDTNLIEALRLVQCMLDDYRERNYGDAQGWIRHINTHMSDYTEAHGDDAYSVLHNLITAAPAK